MNLGEDGWMSPKGKKGKKVPDKENPIDLGWQLHLKKN